MTTLPAFKLFKVTTLLLFSHLHFIGIMQPKKLEFRKLNSTSQAYIRQPIGGQPKLLEYKQLLLKEKIVPGEWQSSSRGACKGCSICSHCVCLRIDFDVRQCIIELHIQFSDISHISYSFNPLVQSIRIFYSSIQSYLLHIEQLRAYFVQQCLARLTKRTSSEL